MVCTLTEEYAVPAYTNCHSVITVFPFSSYPSLFLSSLLVFFFFFLFSPLFLFFHFPFLLVRPSQSWLVVADLLAVASRTAWSPDTLGLEMASVAVPALLGLAADPVASLVDTLFVAHIGGYTE